MSTPSNLQLSPESQTSDVFLQERDQSIPQQSTITRESTEHSLETPSQKKILTYIPIPRPDRLTQLTYPIGTSSLLNDRYVLYGAIPDGPTEARTRGLEVVFDKPVDLFGTGFMVDEAWVSGPDLGRLFDPHQMDDERVNLTTNDDTIGGETTQGGIHSTMPESDVMEGILPEETLNPSMTITSVMDGVVPTVAEGIGVDSLTTQGEHGVDGAGTNLGEAITTETTVGQMSETNARDTRTNKSIQLYVDGWKYEKPLVDMKRQEPVYQHQYVLNRGMIHLDPTSISISPYTSNLDNQTFPTDPTNILSFQARTMSPSPILSLKGTIDTRFQLVHIFPSPIGLVDQIQPVEPALLHLEPETTKLIEQQEQALSRWPLVDKSEEVYPGLRCEDSGVKSDEHWISWKGDITRRWLYDEKSYIPTWLKGKKYDVMATRPCYGALYEGWTLCSIEDDKSVHPNLSIQHSQNDQSIQTDHSIQDTSSTKNDTTKSTMKTKTKSKKTQVGKRTKLRSDWLSLDKDAAIHSTKLIINNENGEQGEIFVSFQGAEYDYDKESYRALVDISSVVVPSPETDSSKQDGHVSEEKETLTSLIEGGEYIMESKTNIHYIIRDIKSWRTCHTPETFQIQLRSTSEIRSKDTPSQFESQSLSSRVIFPQSETQIPTQVLRFREEGKGILDRREQGEIVFKGTAILDRLTDMVSTSPGHWITFTRSWENEKSHHARRSMIEKGFKVIKSKMREEGCTKSQIGWIEEVELRTLSEIIIPATMTVYQPLSMVNVQMSGGKWKSNRKRLFSEKGEGEERKSTRRQVDAF
ncbi:hypothetical protein TREMEDRAFT_63743 [Tremella mesenterica DSM 1558]|uniref:uncharacterized protein n=1 Tax=Tremella mesenterica (strain ATCC 24925 / CBS 8224 / DSM 1558 / NBRC 9311 / NRRL Y-6157 / RJB 2259-6 / UBC 559-6) TaxID=578456 RepID=UPI0003F4A4D8|nr:uncharacterized protein TREMEDRAFT_63743 [Tremella mesenterica DSM 1558]EIW67852.1 hypothetical protein TREMEDRAFT_63743 [Tremella mesenterica DSM 1558]